MPGLTETQKQVQTTEQPWWMTDYSEDLGTAAVNQVIDPATGKPRELAPYTGNLQAPTNDYLKYSQDATKAFQAPDFSTANTQMSDSAAAAQGQYSDPNAVKIGTSYDPLSYGNSNYQTQNVEWNDFLAGYSPEVQAFLTEAASVNIPDYMAEKYNFTPERIAAMQIGSPERGNIRDVSGPGNIEAYLMAQPDTVISPELKQYLINQTHLVNAERLADPRMWDAASRDEYMSPYQQGVTDVAKRKATEDFYQQLANAGGRAAAAGALGGSRQAVVEGQMRRDAATQLSDIQTQGLQAAYENAQQQFERDRLAKMNTGQFNIQSGLTAAMANQQALNERERLNQAAQLSVQQLGTESGLRAQIANQQARLATEQGNQGARMSAQQLREELAQRAQIANQQADTAFSDVGLRAAIANMDADLRAKLANQSTGLEAEVTGAKMSQGDKQFGYEQLMNKSTTNANLLQQANLANQSTKMAAQDLREKSRLQALTSRGEMGLRAGIANQQAGLDTNRLNEQSKQFGFQQFQQGKQFGADLDLRGQTETERARSQRTRDNLTAATTSADIWKNIAQNDQMRADLTLRGNDQLMKQGMFQQEQDQLGADRALDMWKLQQAFPMLSMSQLSQIMANMPNQSTVTQTGYQKMPSVFQQIMGALVAVGGQVAGGMAGKG